MSDMLNCSIILFVIVISFNSINSIPMERINNSPYDNSDNAASIPAIAAALTLGKDNKPIPSSVPVASPQHTLNPINQDDAIIAEPLKSERKSDTENKRKKTPQKDDLIPLDIKEEYFENGDKNDDVGYIRSFHQKGEKGYTNFEIFNNQDKGQYEHTGKYLKKKNSNKKKKNQKTKESDDDRTGDDESENEKSDYNAQSRIDLEIPEEISKQLDEIKIIDNEEAEGKITPKVKRHNHFEANQLNQLHHKPKGYEVHENAEERKKVAVQRLIQSPYKTEIIFTTRSPVSRIDDGGYQAFVVHDINNGYTAPSVNPAYVAPGVNVKNFKDKKGPLYSYDYPSLNVNFNEPNSPNYNKPITILRDKIRVDYGDDPNKPTNFNDKYEDIDYGDKASSSKNIPVSYYEDDTNFDSTEEDTTKGKKGKNKKNKSQYFTSYSSFEEKDGDGVKRVRKQQAEYDEYDEGGEDDDEGKKHAAQSVEGEGDYDDDGEVVEHAAEEEEEGEEGEEEDD